MMITCTVGELQWPITKDAPVIRVHTRGFGFAMSGLLYGLQFSSSCQEAMMDTLETIFMKFADYKHLRRGEVGNFINLTPMFFFFIYVFFSNKVTM